jgi:hypothetical protein
MKRIISFVIALGLAAAVQAADTPAGVVTSASGKITLYSAAKANKAGALRLGQQLYAGDRVQTGANGRLALVLTDGTQLKVNYNTDITLRDKDTKGRESARGIASIKVALGDLWAKVTKKNSRLEFETPSAVAAVKGTTLELNVTLDELCAKLKEGKLDVANDLGGVSLTDLQMTCVRRGQKPPKPQAWDGKDSWTGNVGGASGAEVDIEYTDGDDRKSLKLEYGK